MLTMTTCNLKKNNLTAYIICFFHSVCHLHSVLHHYTRCTKN